MGQTARTKRERSSMASKFTALLCFIWIRAGEGYKQIFHHLQISELLKYFTKVQLVKKTSATI